MKAGLKLFALVSGIASLPVSALATSADTICPRSAAGSIVTNPPDAVPDRVGVIHLVARNTGNGPEADTGLANFDYRLCLLNDDRPSLQGPVLRVNPGQRLNVQLQNRLQPFPGFPKMHVMASANGQHHCTPLPASMMGDISLTNLHFHGLSVSPQCGGDEVLNTMTAPPGSGGRPDYKYSFTIPSNAAPGLYWYHPHIHGISQQQLLGGMSGVLVVSGMEKYYPAVAGLRERIFVLRDHDKPDPADNPAAPPDEPWKNVSINYVPVNWDPSGATSLPRIQVGAGERQFWRVANASADTAFVLKLQFRYSSVRGWEDQPLELLARDGVPLAGNDGSPRDEPLLQKQLVLPPGARAEFIITGPAAGTEARLYSDDYNRYLLDSNHHAHRYDATDRQPARVLAQLETTAAPRSLAARSSASLRHDDRPRLQRFTHMMKHEQIRTRKLFFTKDPGDKGNFFITVDGNKPHAFAMDDEPDVVVNMPAVEDWVIENRDNESHVFHIHQIHFRVLEVNGTSRDEQSEAALLDTLVLPPCRNWGHANPESPYDGDPDFYGGNCREPYRVKLRMEFSDPDLAGTFVYHCHIMEHEDKGMMAKIRLEWNPRQAELGAASR